MMYSLTVKEAVDITGKLACIRLKAESLNVALLCRTYNLLLVAIASHHPERAGQAVYCMQPACWPESHAYLHMVEVCRVAQVGERRPGGRRQHTLNRPACGPRRLRHDDRQQVRECCGAGNAALQLMSSARDA